MRHSHKGLIERRLRTRRERRPSDRKSRKRLLLPQRFERAAHARRSSGTAPAANVRVESRRAPGGAESTGAVPAAQLGGRGLEASTRRRRTMLFEPVHLSGYASAPRFGSGIVDARLAGQQPAPSLLTVAFRLNAYALGVLQVPDQDPWWSTRPPVRLGFDVRAIGSTRSVT